MRLLYFDIDGAILDYEDRVKAGFLSGVLEAELRRAGFDRLICVSGWSDIFQEPVLRIPVSQRGAFLHKKIAAAFRDSDWFLRLLVLTTDTDNRCRGIDLAADGYYMDDRADEYFVNAHGPQAFEVEQGRRVLPVDPFSDGSDVLDWLKTIPAPSVFCRLPAEL